MVGCGWTVLNRVRKQRDGAVAAEFGMVAPLFFALAMGGIEYGSVAFSMSSLQLAANVAAREVAVNRISEGDARARMEQYLPGWMGGGNVTMTVSESNPTQPRINIVKIRLQAPASSATPISIFTKAMSWTLVAEANVQQEMPFDNAAAPEN